MADSLQGHDTKETICCLWEVRAALRVLSRLRAAPSRKTYPATWIPLGHRGGPGTERDSLHENGKPTQDTAESAPAVTEP